MTLGKSYKISGKHFQSWKNFELSVSGFTVIIGPSDRGKSAIIRALKGILRNEVSANHITFGEKEATVTLQPETGDQIELTRNLKTTLYKIGEEEFSKLAGGIPPDVANLRCNEVDVNGVKLDPIFAGQFDQQFMLDMTPAELNSIFGLFSSTEKLNAGKKVAGAKNTEFNSNAKYLANEILESEVKVHSLSDLMLRFEIMNDQIDELSLAIEETQTNVTNVGALHFSKQFTAFLNRVITVTIPSIEEMEATITTIKQISAYSKKKQYVSGLREVTVKKIGKADTLTEQTHLILNVADLIKLKHRISALPSVTNTDLKTSEVKAILDSTLSLGKYVESVGSVANIKHQLKVSKTEYKRIAGEIASLKTNGVECPECGNFFQLGEDHGNH